MFSCFSTANAADIFKWVDEDGVTHFSQTPPESGTQSQTLEMPVFPPPAQNPADDYYSIANQAKRLETSRLAIEKNRFEQRLAEEKLALEQANAQQQAYQDDSTYYPVYGVSGYGVSGHRRYNRYNGYRPGYARPPGQRPPGIHPPSPCKYKPCRRQAFYAATPPKPRINYRAANLYRSLHYNQHPSMSLQINPAPRFRY